MRNYICILRPLAIGKCLNAKKVCVEIVLLIVLKLCCVVLWHSEVGEKLQRVVCRGEVVDRNFVVERL